MLDIHNILDMLNMLKILDIQNIRVIHVTQYTVYRQYIIHNTIYSLHYTQYRIQDMLDIPIQDMQVIQ